MIKSAEQEAAEWYPEPRHGFSYRYLESHIMERERAAYLKGHASGYAKAKEENDKLLSYLSFRDDFICVHGLWQEFMDTLAAPESP